jgi:hypothetical protein
MKNQDHVSKRILTLALAVSMILCSAALFVFSLNFTGKAKAATITSPSISTTKVESRNAAGDAGFIAGVGISNGFAYYIYLAPDGHSIYWKANLSNFKDSDSK